ncbi:hypothetical protein FAZ95_36285 [Trinickia violacea]|uniref:Uncharacterized protein n=1 Tax=Trinickia violacea TaxID=2571746 RepID=A0A4P8J0V3_9BURK|nr:hypothetical protein [Trinickia violacea]QCP54397.1 hypothetical protein FAZ95_36285 [Trinickia violacea]
MAQTPGVMRELDQWLCHRLRTIQLKNWERRTTMYRDQCCARLDDPTKRRAGAVMGMDAALSTLKRECAEQGLDFDLPDWAGAAAESIASPPEAPTP